MDQLGSRSDEIYESSSEESKLETTIAYPSTSVDPDVAPISDNCSTGNDNLLSLSVSPSSLSLRYPHREHHQPPDRLVYS